MKLTNAQKIILSDALLREHKALMARVKRTRDYDKRRLLMQDAEEILKIMIEITTEDTITFNGGIK